MARPRWSLSARDLDDRGLELAEGFLHEQRQRNERAGIADSWVSRALDALAAVRALTKRPCPPHSEESRMTSQLITIENHSTALNPRDLFNLVWAVNYQVLYHYGRSPWVRDGHAPAAHVAYLPPGVQPPKGAWNLILMDTSDQAGALGYHDDETGSGIPFSDVFVKSSIADGAQPSTVAAHEALEMLVDPNVTRPRVAPNPAEAGRQYIVEVGDPVQGCDYDVGAPEGRATGTLVCDFALPAWWGLKQSGTNALSYRASVSAPFEVAPQGYISWCPAGANPADPSVWQQTFGQHRAALPAWASRLPRVHPV